MAGGPEEKDRSANKPETKQDGGQKKEGSPASSGVQWATVAVALLTALATAWNFYSTRELQLREAAAKEEVNRLNASVRQLEIQNQQDVDKAKLNIARFEFLLKLKAEMLQGGDPKSQIYALNIAKLILSPGDYSAFTSGLLAQPEKQGGELTVAQTSLREALKSASTPRRKILSGLSIS